MSEIYNLNDIITCYLLNKLLYININLEKLFITVIGIQKVMIFEIFFLSI